MDQVAHLPIRGDPQSDSVKRVIAASARAGTVIDPTESWSEIGGHSTAEPVQNFQPVRAASAAAVRAVPRRRRGAAPTVDTATAHARLARTLLAIRALHEAGVPIVAGTDEGVPGFSVYREIELYVKAGIHADGRDPRGDVGARRRRCAWTTTSARSRPGKRADLLVLDANPLENISNIRTRALGDEGRAAVRQRGAVAGGRLHAVGPRDSLTPASWAVCVHPEHRPDEVRRESAGHLRAQDRAVRAGLERNPRVRRRGI